MLNGENIVLRPLRSEDHELFFKWRNDLEYIRLTKSFRFPKAEGSEKQWLEAAMADRSNKSVTFIIESKVNDSAIGFVALNSIDWFSRSCQFGIAIPESEAQNQGFGRQAMELILDYAFGVLNLRKVSLEVTAFNENSIHLYESIGFVQEGVLRKHYYWDSTYHDVLVYGLLREDYDARG